MGDVQPQGVFSKTLSKDCRSFERSATTLARYGGASANEPEGRAPGTSTVRWLGKRRLLKICSAIWTLHVRRTGSVKPHWSGSNGGCWRTEITVGLTSCQGRAAESGMRPRSTAQAESCSSSRCVGSQSKRPLHRRKGCISIVGSGPAGRG